MTATTIKKIALLKPERPIFAFRPHSVIHALDYFNQHFLGQVLYAVKTNPEPHILELLSTLGLKHFEVASIAEIIRVKEIQPSSRVYFMHPIKSPKAIAEAYFEYQVRDFAVDSYDELKKILKATHNAPDLNLFLRVSIANDFAKFDFSKKFGATLNDAPALLKAMAQKSHKVGLCCHVGSQCMAPEAYKTALNTLFELWQSTGVKLHYLDIGGGFPSIYPDLHPPALSYYFKEIHEGFAKFKQLDPEIELLAEPGRAIVAESTSLLIRVELRKDHYLYVNEGTYGSLFDAGLPGFIFPTQNLNTATTKAKKTAFSFYGPTCDSLDFMPGPFQLPETTRAGDYLEVGQLGAYGRTISSSFNGFQAEQGIVIIKDKPMLSMYPKPAKAKATNEAQFNAISLLKGKKP